MPPGIKCPRCTAFWNATKKTIFVQKVEEGDDHETIIYADRGLTAVGL